MTFRETLDKHMRAIRERDLDALAETLPADQLVLITSDGRLVTAVAEFLAMHRGWFAQPTWSLGTELVSLRQPPARLHSGAAPPGRRGGRGAGCRTGVSAGQGDGRVMVQDQNTPVRGGAP